jgi:hypothetical protein
VSGKRSAADQADGDGFPGAKPSGGARWTDARCLRTFQRRAINSRNPNLWWLPESGAYPLQLISEGTVR